jgi:hypothetical protein
MQLHTLDPSNNNVEIGAQQDFEWTEGELVHVTNEFWDYVAANQGHVPIPIQIDRFAFFVLQGLPVLNFCNTGYAVAINLDADHGPNSASMVRGFRGEMLLKMLDCIAAFKGSGYMKPRTPRVPG